MEWDEKQEHYRRRIEEARDTLRDSQMFDHAFTAMRELLPPREDPVAKWRREQEEAEAARDQEQMQTAAELNQQRTREWEAWADARIDRALAEHNRGLTEVLGQVVAEERHRMREHVAEQIGLLRAELTVQREAERGQILDLPALPLRRRDAA